MPLLRVSVFQSDAATRLHPAGVLISEAMEAVDQADGAHRSSASIAAISRFSAGRICTTEKPVKLYHGAGDFNSEIAEHVGIAAKFIVVPAVNDSLGHRYLKDRIVVITQ